MAERVLDFLQGILACAHPLILSNPDESYPFFRGTCFTLRYQRRFFVLTAKHCFNDVDVRNTRIDSGGRENEYFPLKRWSYFETAGVIDSDFADIAVFEVDVERMTPAEISRAPRVELGDSFMGRHELPPRCHLFLEGYPCLNFTLRSGQAASLPPFMKA